MTPEERAAMKAALLDAGKRSEALPYGPIVCDLSHGPYMELCLDRIAAAIREAVKAEREGAAAMAESAQRDASTGGAYAVWNRACSRIAAAIRARTP